MMDASTPEEIDAPIDPSAFLIDDVFDLLERSSEDALLYTH